MEPRDTHDLGRLYWHTDTRKKSWKPTQISRSQMVTTPFRRGLGVFFAIPGVKRGIVLGWWGRKNRYTVSHLVTGLPQHLFPGTRVVGEKTEEVRDWV